MPEHFRVTRPGSLFDLVIGQREDLPKRRADFGHAPELPSPVFQLAGRRRVQQGHWSDRMVDGEALGNGEQPVAGGGTLFGV